MEDCRTSQNQVDDFIDGKAIWSCYETDNERSKYRRRISEFIHPLLERWGALKVLEVGAGNGHGTLCLVELGYDCQAIDPHFRADIEDLYPFLHKGSGLSLPFDDREFDVSFSLEVIEHVGTTDGMLSLATDYMDQRKIFIREICRVTRERVVIATPNKRFLIDEHGESFLGGFRLHSPFERETLSVRELKSMFLSGGFILDEYLSPRGYYAFERVERILGKNVAAIAQKFLHGSSNRFLGPSPVNPHLFLSFRRTN